MTKEEFYKTIVVVPTNLKMEPNLSPGWEKYDWWELSLMSYCSYETIKKGIYGRIEFIPKATKEGEVKLCNMQKKMDKAVERMYKCLTAELKKEKEGEKDGETDN